MSDDHLRNSRCTARDSSGLRGRVALHAPRSGVRRRWLAILLLSLAMLGATGALPRGGQAEPGYSSLGKDEEAASRPGVRRYGPQYDDRRYGPEADTRRYGPRTDTPSWRREERQRNEREPGTQRVLPLLPSPSDKRSDTAIGAER